MAQDLSLETLAAIHGSSTGNVTFVMLVSIAWPALATPFRYTSNNADVTYDGDTYEATPITAPWPQDKENELSRGSVVIDNCDPALIEALQQRPQDDTGKITVTLIRTIAEDPDGVDENDVPHAVTNTLRVERRQWDETTLTLSSARKLPWDAPFPPYDFNPKENPALFGV